MAEDKAQGWQQIRLGSDPPFHKLVEEEMKKEEQQEEYPMNGPCC